MCTLIHGFLKSIVHHTSFCYWWKEELSKIEVIKTSVRSSVSYKRLSSVATLSVEDTIPQI